MSRARFAIDGARLDMASRPSRGTVLIERGPRPLFSVRPLRRHRTYEMALADVASLVVRSILLAEARTKRAEAKSRRRG